ncbi:hypothetical protein KIW84_044923 [Lathyrus oleraceus]|uniref:Glycosyl transferase 48 domain-containing protein n=1 Tax=Pisum sativum TaxID=3888 RepID=A0A9D4XJ06_PEA|nr:hypothetical protein KIW84_044923 [Pisum sativum]
MLSRHGKLLGLDTEDVPVNNVISQNAEGNCLRSYTSGMAMYQLIILRNQNGKLGYGWNNLLLLNAFQYPVIFVGTKKMQQKLANPDVLEMFFENKDDIANAKVAGALGRFFSTSIEVLDVAGIDLCSAGLQELQSTLIAPPLVDVNAANNSMPIESLPTNLPYAPVRLAAFISFLHLPHGHSQSSFGRTILHGGAKYRATGRGFVVEHKCFAEIYRLFSCSHFVKAIELGLILDFDDFMNWIWYHGSVFAKAEQSWERWWYEEHDHLKLGISAGNHSLAIYALSWIYVVVVSGIYVVVVYARNKYSAKEHIPYLLVQFLAITLAILVVVALLEFTEFNFVDILTSLLAFLPTGWGLTLITLAILITVCNHQTNGKPL